MEEVKVSLITDDMTLWRRYYTGSVGSSWNSQALSENSKVLITMKE